MDKTAIRDAATIIVLRKDGGSPSVLMGQRGANAAFMPGKFVFPGGAIDANDADVPCTPLPQTQAARLSFESKHAPQAIAAAAIRELWEETGQILGEAAAWTNPPQGWRGFAKAGYVPKADALTYFFRAVTPEGRPRRFDARFLLAEASALVTDPDDFSRAEDELSHLQWVPLADARAFDLPFITQVVLAELIQFLSTEELPDGVPFFRNDAPDHRVGRIV